jgi:hypothetical protein
MVLFISPLLMRIYVFVCIQTVEFLFVFVCTPDKDADDIPLLNVKSSVLKKVVEYMSYHFTTPPKEMEKV